MGPDAVKNLPSRNDHKIYLENRVAQLLFMQPVTFNEIINTVKTMPSKSFCDYYGISSKIIKLIINVIAKPHCLIFNKSFYQGNFSDSLKIARIVLMYKSGDRDVKNYRPIFYCQFYLKFLKN